MNNTFLTLTAITVVSLCLSRAAQTAAPTPISPTDPWKPVRVLLGKWEGASTGQSGAGKTEREYKFTLNNRFIHVSSRSVYPPQEKNAKGETHEEVGFISFDKAAKKLIIRQFHVEGFVNQYVMERSSEGGQIFSFVTFAIENITPGWRARETYRIISDDEFIETFALAEPGKDFVTYTETRFRRKK